jgi:hypothetical protein
MRFHLKHHRYPLFVAASPHDRARTCPGVAWPVNACTRFCAVWQKRLQDYCQIDGQMKVGRRNFHTGF